MQIDTQNNPPNFQIPSHGISSTTGSESSKSYTILRIKRKRNEEPLDALVVESRVRRKKSRGGIGVFQYAETVENDAWDDANKQKDIQEKISHLARETAAKMEMKATIPSVSEGPPSPISRRTQEDIARRYTIVDQEKSSHPSRRFPTAPPKVISSKGLEKSKSTVDFKMYDAVPTEEPQTKDEPSEMDKFLPMLNDYLKIHNLDLSAETSATAIKSGSNLRETTTKSQSSSDDDYVWDVFYHRPVTLSEWSEVSNVGSVSGLPPSFGDGYDSASDSGEELDEADEDSNAEEYYKNDYPEDEDSSNSDSGDEFHDDSEYDDIMDYRDNAEQFNF